MIDLRPLLSSRDAAGMLLLARGQLNAAFRAHGAAPPDPLVPDESAPVLDEVELDDPAAGGIAHAQARFGEAFDTWASAMPLALARPVAEVLCKTLATLERKDDDAAPARAVRAAHDFLLRHLSEED